MGESALAQRLSSMATQTVPAPALRAATGAVYAVVARARAAGASAEGLLLEEALRALVGGGGATVMGTKARLPAPWAALANAASAARAADSEPGDRLRSEPAAPVVAAAIAVAETLDASGAELLSAVAVGVEVTLRVREGVGQSMSANGWDVTAALGGLGAAVAAGRLLGLDESALTAAIGIASTRAAGFSSARGTDVTAFQVGKGAADGIEAARMAERGFTAPVASIEGRRGLGYLLAVHPSYPTITAELGDLWLIAPPGAGFTGENSVQPDGDPLPDDGTGGGPSAADALRRTCWGLPAASGLSELLAEARRPAGSQRRFPHSLEKA
jgi:2-methylcitrate dehydratase PrpD